MIYLFYGEDTLRSREKLNGLLEAVLAKKGEEAKRSFFEIEGDNFNEDYFKTLVFSKHLFGEKNLVVLKNTLKNDAAYDVILKSLDGLKSSENIFAFLEEILDKKTVGAFRDKAVKIIEFKKLAKENLQKWALQKAARLGIDTRGQSARNMIISVAEKHKENPQRILRELEKAALGCREEPTQKKETTNIFKLTDMIAAKNKTAAWVVFQKLLMSGENDEIIFWKIFWLVKNLAAAKPFQNETAEALAEKFKMHPYAAKKTLAAARNFSEREILRLSENLTKIYKENRLKKVELAVGIERLILNL